MVQFVQYALFIVSLSWTFGPTACFSSALQLNEMAENIYLQKMWPEPLPPNEFISDGCSLWPDNGWVECCVIHDMAYWMGGSREERKLADTELRECVNSSGHPVMALIMYFGVRGGGVYWLPTPYRWGFGWDYPQSGPPDSPY